MRDRISFPGPSLQGRFEIWSLSFSAVLLLSWWQTLKTIVLFFSLLISKKERRSIDYLAKAFDPAVWLKRERSRIRLDAKKAGALEFQGIPTKLKEWVASEMLAISGRWIFSALWWNVGSFIELSSSAIAYFVPSTEHKDTRGDRALV